MQKIKILDPQEAIKIAAGEVVERPAHILKELIENSVDAGATEIIIYSEQAGKKLLKVTDNGSGMSPEDALLCFTHHATSKINKVEDLDTIATYGFRGEALASITSVANVTLITKTADVTSATKLILQQNNITKQESTAHPTGTTIMVQDLFANIPARKKFLKSHDTEWNAIVTIFQAFCLRYPHIHFKLFHDNKLSYNCPISHDIVQRSAQLWSNNLHDHLITIPTTAKNNITVHGAISSSHYHRYNRNQMFIFVNNRWVKNIELARAIIKGYQNTLPPQKYPAVIISIEIDSTEVDINIHPKKEEVKFLHPGIVQKFIQEIITKALSNAVTNTLTQNTSKQTIIQQQTKQPVTQVTSTFDSTDSFQTSNHSLSPTIKTIPNQNSLLQSQKPYTKSSSTAIDTIPQEPFAKQSTNKSVTKETNQTIYTQEPFSIVGQFKNTYIIIEKSQEIIFIDQHAAHERILYENYKKDFTNVATVQLLFPHIIKLTNHDLTVIKNHHSLFSQHGIIFEQFSETELIIQATPVSLQNQAINEIITTTIHWIKEHEHVDEQLFFKKLHEQIHAQKACKTACKAGDTLSTEQMLNIVTTLMTIENRFSCPHGRPTMWNMSLKEVEKQFHRDYKSKKNHDLW